MTSIKKAISSIVAACAICGALTCGAFASTNKTNATNLTAAKATVNSLNFEFNEVYQDYMLMFYTGPITRYASSQKFATTITIFRVPIILPQLRFIHMLPMQGPYSYGAAVKGAGTYSANYIYYSANSTESKSVVLGLLLDSRETPGSRFKITGTFYPNGM